MVERIRTLLKTRQLTPTQFADAIGIARPIVSHILSGRNKPSLEVVQRILGAMPDISMPWLLNGSGPMLAASVASVVAAVPPTAEPQAEPQQVEATVEVPLNAPVPTPAASLTLPVTRSRQNPTAYKPALETPSVAAAKPAPKRFAPAAPKPDPAPAKPAESVPLVDAQAAPALFPKPADEATTAPVAAAPEPAETKLPDSKLPDAAALFAGGEKPIRRIVIFYKDGSFADYQPE